MDDSFAAMKSKNMMRSLTAMTLIFGIVVGYHGTNHERKYERSALLYARWIEALKSVVAVAEVMSIAVRMHSTYAYMYQLT